jgi:NAD(P)H dehydrogenase (quinone)
LVRILVIYDSETGNTEKMAQAVAEGAKEVTSVKVIVKKVSQTTLKDLVNADGIIIGSPTYYGQMSGRIKTFIDKSEKIHGKLEGRIGGAFTSSGGTASGAETTLLSILHAMLVHGMIVQGRHDNKHYGAAAVGKPNKTQIDDCKQLGRRIAALTQKLRA